MIGNLNILAVIGGAIISMIVGFVWYSKALFANQWMKLIGKTEKELAADANGMLYMATMAGAFIASLILAVLVSATGVNTAVNGAALGVMLGVVAFTALMSTALFERRPLKLLLINGLYHVVWLALAGALIGAWR